MSEERWVACTRSDLYEVSDLGRVRRKATGYVLTQSTNSSRMGRRPGYRVVSLCTGSRKAQKSAYVHQLVAEAFHGPRPDGHDVDHVDHDRTNNAAANLRWMPLRANRVRWKGPGRTDFVLAKEEPAPEDHEPMTEEERDELDQALARPGW